MNARQRSALANSQRGDRENVGGPRLLSSTLKCLRLLEVVADSDRPVGVSELVRRVGGSRAGIHLQLTTLAHAGWLERVDGGRYRLTLRPLRIGHSALNQGGIGGRVVPVLEELAAATGESISLSVLDGAEALIVWRIESAQMLRTDLSVGTRMPIRESASGRVLAAFADPDRLELAVAAGARLPDRELVEVVRRDGYAVSVDEYAEGIAAIAAPVTDHLGQAVGALSIAGPSSRLVPAELVEFVCSGARKLSVLLGDRLDG